MLLFIVLKQQTNDYKLNRLYNIPILSHHMYSTSIDSYKTRSSSSIGTDANISFISSTSAAKIMWCVLPLVASYETGKTVIFFSVMSMGLSSTGGSFVVF